MRRRAETHKPGSVAKIIKASDVADEQAEIRLDDTDPARGKLRIVNTLFDDTGQKHRLQEGESVDVIIGSDDIATDKR